MDIPTPKLPGRALTSEQKRAIIERVLVAWERQPQLRLGQLVNNAIAKATKYAKAERQTQKLYFVEDETFADILEGGPLTVTEPAAIEGWEFAAIPRTLRYTDGLDWYASRPIEASESKVLLRDDRLVITVDPYSSIADYSVPLDVLRALAALEEKEEAKFAELHPLGERRPPPIG